jgi:hypothetical protein
VKHNEPLTAVLPELCELEGVQVAAIIRHPIPTILSWQSRDIPLSKGNLPGYRHEPVMGLKRVLNTCFSKAYQFYPDLDVR